MENFKTKQIFKAGRKGHAKYVPVQIRRDESYHSDIPSFRITTRNKYDEEAREFLKKKHLDEEKRVQEKRRRKSRGNYLTDDEPHFRLQRNADSNAIQDGLDEQPNNIVPTPSPSKERDENKRGVDEVFSNDNADREAIASFKEKAIEKSETTMQRPWNILKKNVDYSAVLKANKVASNVDLAEADEYDSSDYEEGSAVSSTTVPDFNNLDAEASITSASAFKVPLSAVDDISMKFSTLKRPRRRKSSVTYNSESSLTFTKLTHSTPHSKRRSVLPAKKKRTASSSKKNENYCGVDLSYGIARKKLPKAATELSIATNSPRKQPEAIESSKPNSESAAKSSTANVPKRQSKSAKSTQMTSESANASLDESISHPTAKSARKLPTKPVEKSFPESNKVPSALATDPATKAVETLSTKAVEKSFRDSIETSSASVCNSVAKSVEILSNKVVRKSSRDPIKASSAQSVKKLSTKAVKKSFRDSTEAPSASVTGSAKKSLEILSNKAVEKSFRDSIETPSTSVSGPAKKSVEFLSTKAVEKLFHDSIETSSSSISNSAAKPVEIPSNEIVGNASRDSIKAPSALVSNPVALSVRKLSNKAIEKSFPDSIKGPSARSLKKLSTKTVEKSFSDSIREPFILSTVVDAEVQMNRSLRKRASRIEGDGVVDSPVGRKPRKRPPIVSDDDIVESDNEPNCVGQDETSIKHFFERTARFSVGEAGETPMSTARKGIDRVFLPTPKMIVPDAEHLTPDRRRSKRTRVVGIGDRIYKLDPETRCQTLVRVQKRDVTCEGYYKKYGQFGKPTVDELRQMRKLKQPCKKSIYERIVERMQNDTDENIATESLTATLFRNQRLFLNEAGEPCAENDDYALCPDVQNKNAPIIMKIMPLSTANRTTERQTHFFVAYGKLLVRVGMLSLNFGPWDRFSIGRDKSYCIRNMAMDAAYLTYHTTAD